MAITAANRILMDGSRNVVVQITASADIDGGSENNEVKIDLTKFSPPAERLALKKIRGDVEGGKVELRWHDPQNEEPPFAVISDFIDNCYEKYVLNNTVEGSNGNVIINSNLDSNGSYSLILEFIRQQKAKSTRTEIVLGVQA